jgi:hypothetical protein
VIYVTSSIKRASTCHRSIPIRSVDHSPLTKMEPGIFVP